jgi:putative addiction module component (TIGR02574 family)
MDKKALIDEIIRLPAQERRELVETLLDTVDFDVELPPVTPEQMRELRERLEHHRRNPDEPTFTLDEIRRDLFPD